METTNNDKKSAPQPTEQPVTQDYFFPECGKTVTAASLEEAEKKVTDLAKAENKI